jgi:hypothetical protein
MEHVQRQGDVPRPPRCPKCRGIGMTQQEPEPAFCDCRMGRELEADLAPAPRGENPKGAGSRRSPEDGEAGGEAGGARHHAAEGCSVQ